MRQSPRRLLLLQQKWQFASAKTLGDLRAGVGVVRRLHVTGPRQTVAKDGAEEDSTGRPTAESIILQRINGAGSIHSSFSHLKQDKAPEDDKNIEKESLPVDPTVGLSSVSGIINSVRETRAALQRTPWHRDSKEEMERILFDTYEMVTRLQASGFERGQAAVITGIVRQRVQEAMDQVRLGMLSKSDLENDSYLFRAALQELRMEMQMTRKNDQSVLESQAAGISREIESLAQRTNDLIGNLRSDIEIEVSNHKHETSHEMKGMDMELHELATKYQLLMGEMKTDIEAIKLGSIRRGLITVVLTAMFLGAIFWGPHFAHRVRMRRQEKKGQADSEQELNHESVARGRTGGSGRRRPDAGTEEQGAPLPPPPAAFRNHSHLAIQYEPTISQPSEPPMQQEEQAERVRWGQGALDAPMGESDAQLDSAALAGRQEEDG